MYLETKLCQVYSIHKICEGKKVWNNLLNWIYYSVNLKSFLLVLPYIHLFRATYFKSYCCLLLFCRVSFFVHRDNSSWMINTRNKTHNVLYKFRGIKFPESLEVKLKPQCIYRCQENVNINIIWFTVERCISGFLPKSRIW